MDLGENRGENENPMRYQHPSSEWQFGGIPGGGVARNPSVSMVDSFFPSLWNNVQNLSGTSSAAAIGKAAPGTNLQAGPGFLGPCFAHFNGDSAFIERAARLSCFSGAASGGMRNGFAASDALSPHQSGPKGVSGVPMPVDHGSNSESPRSRNQEQEITSLANEAGDSSSKENDSKKRRRTSQEELQMEQLPGGGGGSSQLSAEPKQESVEITHKTEKNGSSTVAAKPARKQAKDGSDVPKEDYIHVRARRGQATNSHSLAERVRREKISERMKLLQDLVPGCSKVTGKAVMLDEIINYVQSLQRQVEFLSMKLAAVNPRLNIEGLLSKDLLQRQGSSSSTIVYSSEMIHPQFHPAQQGLIQFGINHGMVNPHDSLGRAASVQLSTLNIYKDSASQMANVWDEELRNVVQMTFGTNPQINNQDCFPK